ncbi:Asp-tRNA(Asn)/Glu-tRNA(Gln) amidotransferase subunit GatA [Cohnella sp. GbtcB17]|uniref:Asp-tRNA(Asn)/Glu-tRNA(Gln) amidotransferase subunit GatA n=1 Tax=Cohnella sp. GbtcB17 TaxID=2824762 RepID=UPI001C301F32|nr:Asp-tRNA(Asn)/Glu-tRNA(Gln) amidotransferase subunit GatA [Cohnella sp. GbtcB17]
MSLFNLRLSEVHDRLHHRDLSVQELAQASLARIAETDTKIGAFLTLNEEGAPAQAKAMDASSAAERGLLYGLPAGIKDNIVTEGLRTTCASQFLSNYDPIYDATVVEKLKAAQSVTIGKLNMDEFAMGGSNENSSYQLTRNPWDTDRVPGGSSGGSAASVAAGQVYFSLGSGTGGSVRQPAPHCGIGGPMPPSGLLSRYGLVAFASSLDQIGPLTKNVEDSAYVLQAIAGHDKRDTTSANVDIPDYTAALTGDIKGLRIGVAKEYLGEGIDPQVKARVLEALKTFEALGAEWEEVSLPHTDYAIATYYLLASSEASSNLARFDGVRYGVRAEDPANLLDLYKKSRSEGFGPEVKRRIMLGTYALSSGYYDAYYKKAQQVRTLIKRDFDQAFERFDLIVGPTAPTTAFRIGEQVGDPLTMYLNDICTIPVSLAGVPAISVPCGLADGLPVGLQIIGKPFDESTVLRAAHAFEGMTEFHKLRPAL